MFAEFLTQFCLLIPKSTTVNSFYYFYLLWISRQEYFSVGTYYNFGNLGTVPIPCILVLGRFSHANKICFVVDLSFSMKFIFSIFYYNYKSNRKQLVLIARYCIVRNSSIDMEWWSTLYSLYQLFIYLPTFVVLWYNKKS